MLLKISLVLFYLYIFKAYDYDYHTNDNPKKLFFINKAQIFCDKKPNNNISFEWKLYNFNKLIFEYISFVDYMIEFNTSIFNTSYYKEIENKTFYFDLKCLILDKNHNHLHQENQHLMLSKFFHVFIINRNITNTTLNMSETNQSINQVINQLTSLTQSQSTLINSIKYTTAVFSKIFWNPLEKKFFKYESNETIGWRYEYTIPETDSYGNKQNYLETDCIYESVINEKSFQAKLACLLDHFLIYQKYLDFEIKNYSYSNFTSRLNYLLINKIPESKALIQIQNLLDAFTFFNSTEYIETNKAFHKNFRILTVLMNDFIQYQNKTEWSEQAKKQFNLINKNPSEINTKDQLEENTKNLGIKYEPNKKIINNSVKPVKITTPISLSTTKIGNLYIYTVEKLPNIDFLLNKKEKEIHSLNSNSTFLENYKVKEISNIFQNINENTTTFSKVIFNISKIYKGAQVAIINKVPWILKKKYTQSKQTEKEIISNFSFNFTKCKNQNDLINYHTDLVKYYLSSNFEPLLNEILLDGLRLLNKTIHYFKIIQTEKILLSYLKNKCDNISKYTDRTQYNYSVINLTLFVVNACRYKFIIQSENYTLEQIWEDELDLSALIDDFRIKNNTAQLSKYTQTLFKVYENLNRKFLDNYYLHDLDLNLVYFNDSLPPFYFNSKSKLDIKSLQQNLTKSNSILKHPIYPLLIFAAVIYFYFFIIYTICTYGYKCRQYCAYIQLHEIFD